jgi:outer membrane protein W
MKMRYLCILLCSLISCLVNGQDTLKVTAGHFTTELNFNPFQGDLSLNNAVDQIKVRYFFAGNIALRIGLTHDSRKSKSETSNAYGTNASSQANDKKTSTLGVNFGIEKHFKGTKRLSPFLGGELVFASKSSSQTMTSVSPSNTPNTIETKINGAWQTVTFLNNYQVLGYEERGFFQYGMNLVAGFDFYFAQNVYLGYELAYAVLKTKYKTIDITTTPSTNSSMPDTSQQDFSMGPSLINGLRIGFVF